MSSPDEALDRREAHLWHVRADRLVGSPELDAYRALMSDDERERWHRLRFERDKHRHLITRALVRHVLSRYRALAPAAWRFSEGSHGKPEAVMPPGVEPIRFNLAHTHDCVVCAVTPRADIGVDVEDITRRTHTVDTLDIAERYFSKQEARQLRELPADQQSRGFFDYWTLKEAYIKARGFGLALPLGQFSFEPQRSPIRISFGPSLDDDPGAWQFARIDLDERHACALAIHRGPGPDFAIRVREWP